MMTSDNTPLTDALGKVDHDPEVAVVHDSVAASEVYLSAIVREAPRTLGLMDREEFSPTFGCMDRTYWAWKFTDFSGTRFQEGLCLLSFLFATEFEGNPYYKNPRLLGWIAGGFEYWSKLQHRSGDFDEAYPFERSLAATAFTSFYLSEAWHLLDGALPQLTADRFRKSLDRAGNWLVCNDEKHGILSNHLAAAAAALFHASAITGNSCFQERAHTFVDRILDHQSSEGWYEEYGGADPGYQTHGSFYLARILQLHDYPGLADSLERSFGFLAHFVHPDGSLGGEYASRNTQTYYPAAFEMMAERSGKASWIAAAMLRSVRNQSAVGAASVDAYNYFPLLNNNVFAYLASSRRDRTSAAPEPPIRENGLIHFPDAGIVKLRNNACAVYVATTKGGVVKTFDLASGCLLGNDCGYFGRLKDGTLITSQWSGTHWKTKVTEREVVVEGCFRAVKKPLMRPLSFMGFRMFSMTVGRLRWASYWLKKLLVRVLIHDKREVAIQLRRTITLTDQGVTIRDHLRSALGDRIERLHWIDTFTTIHMGSSRYFIPNELTVPRLASSQDSFAVDPGRLRDGITLERTFRVGERDGQTDRILSVT